jgi:protein-S-isoprenylcysteine O-methyltransferase Ste14
MLALAFAWLLYGAIHSFMASNFFKNFAEKILGKYFRFYRLIYNILAFALLIPIFSVQFSIYKEALWQVSIYQSIIGKFIAIFGVLLISRALQGYDLREFSGTDFNKSQEKNEFKSDGLLKYMRHPIYFGILIFVWGMFVTDASTRSLTSAVAVTIYLFVGIYFEEKKLIEVFGEKYKKYQHDVPMLIPFLKF